MNVSKLDSYQLAMLSAAPSEHQAAALEELRRRSEADEHRRIASLYVDDVQVKEYGAADLNGLLRYGRITQAQHDAEIARRRIGLSQGAK